MLDPYRARLHGAILALASVYNLAFGAWAVLWPLSFFELFEMEPPRYPGIWQCLGMVVGLYGLAYGSAAFRRDLARPFVAIGLLGKLLGPLGWVLAVRAGEFPLRTFPLILFNDLVWWLPFALILLEGTRAGARLRALAPHACALLNALAALAMLLWLRPGTEAAADPALRAAYIEAHPGLWRGGWALWIAAASSLLGFYAWWGARLPAPGIGAAAFLVAVAGFACDMLAEALFVGWLPERLESIGPLGSYLTGAAANGLYTVAGTLLTVKTARLPGWLRLWAWATWAAGYGLTAATLAGSTAGKIACTVLLMALFCPLALLVGRHLR